MESIEDLFEDEDDDIEEFSNEIDSPTNGVGGSFPVEESIEQEEKLKPLTRRGSILRGHEEARFEKYRIN